MLEAKPDSLDYGHPSKTFRGVRFVLLGFDPIKGPKVRSKLINGGGIDVGQYNPNCTHVIVDKLVYDDPISVAARCDGKTLVTGLWVDHSFDIGMPVDPTSIMYQPLRDLNGIPGAKSLIVCLTGYQRQDRDDIMTMVGLMGANFSKPLIANKVTHLICYKFEGEKFELAKKMKKIKLVNHQWLEDCLRAWEILPEANYDKSGYELEMMEAEAKDSEEEPEAEGVHKKQDEERKVNASPHNLQIGISRTYHSPTLKGEASRKPLDTSVSIALSGISNTNDIVLPSGDQSPTLKGEASRKPSDTSVSIALSDVSNINDTVLPSGKEPVSNHSSTLRDITCAETIEQPLKLHESTPISAKIRNNLASTSESTKRSPPSGGTKLSAISYSRKTPRRSSLPLHAEEMANVDNFDTNNGFFVANSKVEQEKYGTQSGFVKTPPDGTEKCQKEGLSGNFPEKMRLDLFGGSSKLQKMSLSPKTCTSEYLINGPVEINNLTHGHNASFSPGAALKSPVSATNSSSYSRKLLPSDISSSKTATSEIRQDNNAEKAPQRCFNGFKKTIKDFTGKPERALSIVGEPQNKLQEEVDVPSSETKRFEIEKSRSPANLDLSKEEKADSLSKPLRKKMIAKKSLGSRLKLGTGNAANKKGSIYSNNTASQNHTTTCLIGGKDSSGDDEFVNSEKREIPTTVDSATTLRMETNNILNKNIPMDDETESPEDTEKNGFEGAVCEEKYREVEPEPIGVVAADEKSEGVHVITNETHDNILGMHDQEMTSGGIENGKELENTVCDRKNKLGESTCKENTMEDDIIEEKRHQSSKTKRKTGRPVAGAVKQKEIVDAEEAKNDINNKKKGKEKEKHIFHPGGKTKRTLPVNKLGNSMEVEKENMPVIGDQNVSHSKQIGKVASESKKRPMKRKAGETEITSMQVERVPKVKIEPVWFILRGHRLQRKEFQQVIRRLKGRVCRDSHQWSYQATHFIVPDPICRTEKFFAAAASGRWILKTDYLTASNQAGRFLAEEPYEWHKKGLSEDGAISLEAPRKWRLLRERTGHGAFYGMRIIIYGECIAPPLDTLKRVVKAGDGTILATSPPYTRFLNSGVDFAVVSPGMPRVDIWVQEFLRHEIPCVVADYLVDYVCKPGYPLERHVQYNTRAWAERSFANLQSRAEEIVDVQTSPENHGDTDLPCQVCGSRDRGDVMLICGDESGKTGCGVGTHIDCCDPPLEDVPEEDWFCPKCSQSRNKMNQDSSTKKGTPKKGTSIKKNK